jgi:UDP-2-acetamido-2-deoxy-ribo-hexuluronate aminotransferase
LRAVKFSNDLKVYPMLDLSAQYQQLKGDLLPAMESVMEKAAFINGSELKEFSKALEEYTGIKHVIPCANGTDALQLAFMALDLPEGSEVICPGFTYIAVAEVCKLLKLVPVFAEVDTDTFNLDPFEIEKHITPNTKVIVPVHLFGQCCDMESIMAIAEKHNLFVIEDNAQSIGAECYYSDGSIKPAGGIGHIGTTSFFPSKNLGAYGDGGAVFTNDDFMAKKIKTLANHGQELKYHHKMVGINSRLDTLQAAVLLVKLKHLKQFTQTRQETAAAYDEAFKDLENVKIPKRFNKSSHVFHQYTLQVLKADRTQLVASLKTAGIASMVYYPIPVHKQEAFRNDQSLPICENLCKTVISLPIGTEMSKESIEYITSTFKQIIKQK